MLRPFTQIQIQQVTPFGEMARTQLLDINFVNEYQIDSSWESHTNNCTVKFPKNTQLFNTPNGIFAYGNYNLVLSGTGTELSPNIDAYGTPITYAPLIMKGDIIIINSGYIFRNGSGVDNYCATGSASIQGIQKNNKISSPISYDLFFGYVTDIKSGTPIELKCEDNFYLLKRVPFPKSVWNQKEAVSVVDDPGFVGSTEGTSLYGLMKYILSLVNAKFALNPAIYIPKQSSTGQIFTNFNPYPELSLLDVPSSISAKFSLGYLEIGDMTCAQVLDKLSQQYHLSSTFRGNILQFAFPTYIDSASKDVSESQAASLYPDLNANSIHFFCFRDIYNSSGLLEASGNIFPSHDLDYKSKDDIVLSATVQCQVSNIVPGKSTLSGSQKTKVEKLKAFIYWDIASQSFKSQNLSQDQVSNTQTPTNVDGGERHEFWYPVNQSNANPTFEDLTNYGIAHLKLYQYTGFRGCFTTFGFPFIQWNDNCILQDSTYADRNGMYKIKKVVYKGGMKGLSQEVHLDYRINAPIPTNTLSISMI